MPYIKNNKNNAKNNKIKIKRITSTFDETCPKPVFRDKKKIGFGCCICDYHPHICPYDDMGENVNAMIGVI